MEVQNPLPPLVKQSATYKLFVPKKVEEKIRYLIRKYPHTEWSGVLFYTHTGSFEDNNLEIHCEDIYPMDLGTTGWTEFKMSEDVTAYIADNLDLFDCETGLVHSHHSMGAFFSGQDTKTLNIEGNDTNCFVSLIVDTKGTYVAAITRKVKEKKEITTYYYGKSYEFFGDGEVKIEPPYQAPDVKQKYIDVEAIEYFMLDVEREVVENPLEYLDYRFNEIEKKKEASKPVYPQKSIAIESSIDKDEEFYSWIHSERKKSAEAKEALYSAPEEPTLFDKETMEELIDQDKWEPDSIIIHHLVCQLLTCSLIVNKDIDLKQWVKVHMKKKYDEIFGSCNSEEYDRWADAYVEFIVYHYNDENVPADVYDDFDAYLAKVAAAIIDDVQTYPDNEYSDLYIEKLNNYLIMNT